MTKAFVHRSEQVQKPPADQAQPERFASESDDSNTITPGEVGGVTSSTSGA
jgi:hypothetical protein